VDPEDQVQDTLHDDDDAPWYMGKAKEDFYRRQQAGPDISSEDDPVEVKNLVRYLFPTNSEYDIPVGKGTPQC